MAKSKADLRVVVDNSSEGVTADGEAGADKPPSPEQVEMPFAIVNGEAITQLPKDLYIPPQALEVFLEAFEGPLDLLLYMIRRQNLDILDIPIADITKQYMDYIGLMADMQLELAGEYLVMAATLAEIKSRMLLPRANDPNAGEEVDPRADLVRRLQEYERFKTAAEGIDRIPRMDRDTWVAGAELGERKSSRPLPQVAMQEMLLAFRDVVQRAEMFAHHHIRRERLSVRVRMSDILATLEKQSFTEFVHLFRPEEGRMGVTVTFVAILELVREGLIDIVQTEAYAPLHVRSAQGARGLKLAVDNDAQIGAAANEQSFTAEPTDALPDDDDDDDDDETTQWKEARMSDSYLKNVIEAALLAAARPVSVSELQQIFDEQSRPSPKELRALLDQLAADYEGRGVAIRETANGFRFQVRTEFAQEVSRLWPDRPKKYSRALLETLALIAYRQPITRAEIENVRGVAVNPEIVKTLMERNWVRVVGHRDVPGHPELLGTTAEFLDYFSLKSIEDLPPLAELKSLTDLNLQLPLSGTSPENPAAPEAQLDSGEVALVPAADPSSEVVAEGAPVNETERLDAGADDDADDEELSAPGNASAGLVAAPPSDES